MKRTKIVSVVLTLITILSLCAISIPTASAAILNSNQTLKVGSTGTQVKYLQRNLNGLAYNCGDVDGIYGSSTKDAVTRFQKMYGLTADGIAGPKTLDKLTTLINNIETKLFQGHYLEMAYVDTVFTSKTTSAIKSFQNSKNLTVDGIAGPATLKALLG